jgi:hypothetical protein
MTQKYTLQLVFWKSSAVMRSLKTMYQLRRSCPFPISYV